MSIEYALPGFIAHLQPGKPATLRIGRTIDKPDADFESLHKQLKRLFNTKPGKKYGRFGDDIGQSPFSALLKDYLEGKQPFSGFAQKILEQWRDLITSIQEEHIGHLILVHEKLADSSAFFLFVAETDSALRFDGHEALDTVDILSLNRLNLALRIEIDDWLNQASDNYLTLVHGRGTGEAGEQFVNLSGFTNQVDIEKETLTFLDAVEAFARSSEPEKAGEVRHKAYEFCKEQHALGEPVAIDQLSGYLDENQPARFKQFAEENAELPESGVLHPDHRKVKKLVRIAGSGGGMSVSFSSDLVNQAVYYDRDKDALTITRLPKALREQLQRYLDNRQD